MITKFPAVSFLFWFGLQSYLIFVNEIGEKGNAQKRLKNGKKSKLVFFLSLSSPPTFKQIHIPFYFILFPFYRSKSFFDIKLSFTVMASISSIMIMFFSFSSNSQKNEGEKKNSQSLLWHGSDIVRYVNLFYFCTKTATYLLTICLGLLVFSNIMTFFFIKVKSKFVFLDIG